MTLPVPARAAALGAALLCAAAPLRAQRTLLPAGTLPDGSTAAIDSASVWRTGDSTFVATAIYRFAAPDSGADRREENGEIDCTQPQRGARRISFMLGDSVVRTADDGANRGFWVPVPEADLAAYHALCTALLGSWAARLPQTYEIADVEKMPELANVREVQRSLPREFPPAERDAGISGTAVVRALVLPDGHVEPSSIRVVTASTEAFRPAAWRVVAGMRFHPAQVHGRPVPVWITIPVSFNFRG